MMLTFARVSKEVSKEDGEWTEAKNVKEKGNMHRDILMIGKFVARRLQPCYISHFFICFFIVMLYDWCYYVLCNQNGDHYAFFRLVSYLIVCWGP